MSKLPYLKVKLLGEPMKIFLAVVLSRSLSSTRVARLVTTSCSPSLGEGGGGTDDDGGDDVGDDVGGDGAGSDEAYLTYEAWRPGSSPRPPPSRTPGRRTPCSPPSWGRVDSYYS